MINLYYVHGSENHFFLLDQNQLSQPLTDAQLTQLVQQLCTHTQLPTADGLLVVSHSSSSDCIGRMQVFNADGSVASMCGNGLRCVGRYLSDKFHQNHFKVETMQDHLQVDILSSIAQGVNWVGVQISPVTFAAADLPYTNLPFSRIINQSIPEFSDHLKFTALAVPNPHLISFVDKDEDLNAPLAALGTKLNQDNPYFTDGVNVSFAKITGPNQLFVRTFERGVGFTNACGTGMSATSMAFAINYPERYQANQPIDVYNPGGMVNTRVHLESPHPWIQLIGNATHVATLQVEESQLLNNPASSASLVDTGEENTYQAFIHTLSE